MMLPAPKWFDHWAFERTQSFKTYNSGWTSWTSRSPTMIRSSKEMNSWSHVCLLISQHGLHISFICWTALEKRITDTEAHQKDLNGHVKALRARKPYKLLIKARHCMTIKHKNQQLGKQETPKRCQLGLDDVKDSKNETVSSGSNSNFSEGSNEQVEASHFESVWVIPETDDIKADGREMEVSLQEKLKNNDSLMVALHKELEMAKSQRGQIAEQCLNMEIQRALVQKEKNVFCSQKQSEVCPSESCAE